MNFLDQNEMPKGDRLAELGAILATGLIRLKQRKSRELTAVSRDSYLHISPDQCRHETVEFNAE